MYKVLVKSCVISRPFTPAESEESSTFRELKAVHETWTNIEILVEFEGQTVGHYTDNKAVVFILGSFSRHTKIEMYGNEGFPVSQEIQDYFASCLDLQRFRNNPVGRFWFKRLS